MLRLQQAIGLASAAFITTATVVRSAETEVALETPDGPLHGTLLTPDKVDSPPFVLIHPGSGPTDRDGNSAALPGKNNSLKYLAEALEKNGIASLRIDKRGIAASQAAGPSEADLRFQTYADDAVAWMSELRQTHKAERIIMLGHSEGALVGALAAKTAKADRYISIAGVGQPAADLLRSQLASKLPPFLMEKAEAAIAELEAGRLLEKPPRALGGLAKQLPSYSNPDLPLSPALVDALVRFIQSPSTLPL